MWLTQKYKNLRRYIGKALYRLLQIPRIHFYKFISYGYVIGQPTVNQPLHTAGRGTVEFESDVTIGVIASAYFFSSCAYIEARSESARIAIGEGTSINNGFSAIAEHSSIHIGKRVLIGTKVEIYDSDFHGISVNERNISLQQWARPVTIGDDVFIGSNVKIMKGVTIGKCSIIANGSVVVKNVPDKVVVGGNPARFIRNLS